MAPLQIDSTKFGELLLAEFPELRERVADYGGLDHLKMMEFAFFTEEASKRGEWKTVEKCLLLADKLLRFGDNAINNAVYVSYLEILPRKGEVHDELRKMMTNDLRIGWARILDYLSKCSRDKR